MADRPAGSRKRRCPHEAIQFCPLYVAAHDAELVELTCIADGQFEFVCLVNEGRMAYKAAVGKLYRRDPQFWQECRAGEEMHEARAQRTAQPPS